MDLNTVGMVAFLMLGSGIIGYFVGRRGWEGTVRDLNDVKTDIANLKGKLSGTQVAVLPAPVTVG